MASCIHIHRDNFIAYPPWPTDERLTGIRPDELVKTSCCYCLMPACETMVTIRAPLMPPSCDRWKPSPTWEYDFDGDPIWWASYYDAQHIIHCLPGFGCDANPRRKIGMHLRCS